MTDYTGETSKLGAGIAGVLLVLVAAGTAYGLFKSPDVRATHSGPMFWLILLMLGTLALYGVDIVARAWFRPVPLAGLFGGRLGTFRAVAGLIVSVPILALLVVGLLSWDGPPAEAWEGLIMFGFIAYVCGRALWRKIA